MGGFLLDFAGYGAWGLGAVFLAIIFTRGLGKIMKDWYKTEEMAQETRNVIQSELEREKAFAQAVLPLIRKVTKLVSDPNNLPTAKTLLGGSIRDTPLWNTLNPDVQNMVWWYVERAQAAENSQAFLSRVKELERFLKRWAK
jgi:hypothetical protein